MIDPISRAVVLCVITNQIVLHETNEEDSELIKAYYAGQRDALEIMKKAIEQIPKKSEWISVEERLPAEHEEIIASWSDDITIVRYDSFHQYINKGLMAWMPLPDLYEKKEG